MATRGGLEQSFGAAGRVTRFPRGHPPFPFARRGEGTEGEWGKRPTGATLGEGTRPPLAATPLEALLCRIGPPKADCGDRDEQNEHASFSGPIRVRHERGVCRGRDGRRFATCRKIAS